MSRLSGICGKLVTSLDHSMSLVVLTFFLTSRSRMSSRRISQDKSDWLIERDGGMEMVQSFAYSYDIGNQVRFASQCWALIFLPFVSQAGGGFCVRYFLPCVKSLIFLGSHGFVPVVNVFFFVATQ